MIPTGFEMQPNSVVFVVINLLLIHRLVRLGKFCSLEGLDVVLFRIEITGAALDIARLGNQGRLSKRR